jgi:threonine/homoserine/homoserine lactone efflux protein
MVETLLLFSAVALVAIVTPGPTVLLALSNGSRFGVRASLPGMFGAVASDFVLVSAAALGLGALLAASEFWFGIVKWVGAAYLAWLGLRLLCSRGALEMPENAAVGSARAVFMRSFLVAVTNPKGYLFVSAVMPQFIDTSMPQLPQYAAIAVLFAALDFAVMFGYALAGARAIRFLRASGRLWLDRVCGGTLLALAAVLALYRRPGASAAA